MKKIYIILLAVVFSGSILAQNVSISANSGDQPDPSAMLDVKSTTKGLLIPRMTATERMAISNPAEGLMVYQTNDVKGFYYFCDAAWQLTGKKYESPVGTIVAFAGSENEIPAGWLLCNGQRLISTDYPELANVIKTYWGNASDDADPNTNFCLPDLRGVFLRGTALGSSFDPDRDSRIELNIGGNTGDKVGSFQYDAFQGHGHSYSTSNGTVDNARPIAGALGSSSDASVYNSIGGPVTYATFGLPKIAIETRPRNANVNYIIKY